MHWHLRDTGHGMSALILIAIIHAPIFSYFVGKGAGGGEREGGGRGINNAKHAKPP